MIVNTGIHDSGRSSDKLDILYARRSSEDGKDGESIENQVALLKQYAADKGYHCPELRYTQIVHRISLKL